MPEVRYLSPDTRTRILRLSRALLVSGLLLLSSGFRPSREPPGRYEFSLQRMGTVFRIVLYAPDRNEASIAANDAFDRLEQLEQIMSDYRETSEVARLCREAVWNPRPVSRELYYVLENSLRISAITGGAFDVTVGPVVALWREARRAKRLPDPQALAKAEAAVGYGNLVLDPRERSVLLKRDDMKIDLGGIGKGYAADEAIKLLKSRGIRSALVDGGGDVTLGDAPPGERGWKIAVHDPDSSPARFSTLMLSNVGVATSGDAYQHLDVDGRRYSHIVNPSNGEGLTDSVSTTVIAPDGITADALATAMSVMPVRDALRVAGSMSGVSVSLVRRVGADVRRFSSSNFPDLSGEAGHARDTASGKK